MSAYATKLAEAFSSQVCKLYYESAVSERITNQDYEGQVRDKASVLNILTFGALALKNYAGAALTADDLTESNAQLVTDQQKAYYFKVRDLDTFKSYIKNPEGTILEQCRAVLAETVDAYVLGLYGDVAAGNRDGTSYTTGTVTVAVTTGIVTPAGGAAFGSSMVGKGFKALGHTGWYRIKAYNLDGTITIEDDKDDETSAYTGGAIGGGATFEIQANSALQVTKDTINARVNALATILNENKIPKSNRWLVVPAGISALIRQAPEYIPAVETAYNEVVKRGLIGMLAGFQVFENQQVSGSSTGWHVLAGHKSGITYAMGMTESGVEDLIGDFGSAYKGLTVYGAKVIDERRKALAEGFWKL